MSEQWFYADGGASHGPVGTDVLAQMARGGNIGRSSLVWRDGLPDWVEAGSLDFLFPAPPPVPAPEPAGPPPVPRGGPGVSPGAAPWLAQSPRDVRGVLGGIGARISAVADLPTLSNVSVKEVLMGGLRRKTGEEDIEETFAVGTASTTPPLSEVQAGWPSPRVFWRVLGGCVAAYLLMRFGLTTFQNKNFIPGLIVVGSFMVPLACVILFFELNTPRNVSIYHVAKLVLIGGALSLVTTLFLFRFIAGAGTGEIVAALLTGVGEETGKALVLLFMVGSLRYPWQLNGMLFGAAVGAGFAGFESAGYAFRQANLSGVFDVIMLRAVLAPGGHVIWTAMIGAAIWRVKGNRRFELSMLVHPIVVRRWCIAVVLHGLWDSNILTWYVQLPILAIVGWYLIFAMLKQAYDGLEKAQEAALLPEALAAAG